ncbi:MAG: YfcC family protein, partial [Flavobacteriales bacterium]
MKWYKKTPDSLIIVACILVLFTLLTWVIPAGAYDREIVDGRSIVVPGTYHSVEQAHQGIGALLQAPLHGFISAAEIIAFVLLVGGAFAMMTATGALDAFLFKILNIAKSKPSMKLWIIAVLMMVFSIAGMTFGMSEETLVFVLLTIPLAKSMGYDSIVGMAIPFVGAGVGFAGAAFNPFTVGIAQGIAELATFSGFGYRLMVGAI